MTTNEFRHFPAEETVAALQVENERLRRALSVALQNGDGAPISFDRWIVKIEENDRLVEALIWCSAVAEFQPGGNAREGWEKICQPLIRRHI